LLVPVVLAGYRAARENIMEYDASEHFFTLFPHFFFPPPLSDWFSRIMLYRTLDKAAGVRLIKGSLTFFLSLSHFPLCVVFP